MIARRDVSDPLLRNRIRQISSLYRQYAGRPTLLTYIRHFHDLGYFRKSSGGIDSSPETASFIFGRNRYFRNP